MFSYYQKIEKTNILITRSETTINNELLMAAPKLKIIGRAAVGTSNIDIETATKRGILVPDPSPWSMGLLVQ